MTQTPSESTSAPGLLDQLDSTKMTRTHWRWTILAVLASYFDAGAIVAVAVSLSMWQETYGMADGTLGLIAAFSANGISAGVGALLGGWLGDKFGRKKIFAVDLLVFMAGAFIVAFSNGPTMIILGCMVVGLAVGVDIPTSFALLAEFSPSKNRGRVFGMSVLAWLLGPTIVSAMSALFAELGLLGSRLIFIHLALVAFIVWWMRRGIPESPRWAAMRGEHEKVAKAAKMLGIDTDSPDFLSSVKAATDATATTLYGRLFARGNMKRLAFVLTTYVIWGIPAGTYGLFTPYLVEHAGDNSRTVSNLVNVLNFGLGVLAAIVFTLIADRVNRRTLWTVGCTLCALVFFAFLFVPITNFAMMITNIVVIAFVGNLTAFPILQLWSVELFPTSVRGTLQGVSFGVMRFAVGIWSLLVVGITNDLGFEALAAMLGTLWVITLLLGVLFGPNTTGRSMAELDAGKPGGR